MAEKEKSTNFLSGLAFGLLVGAGVYHFLSGEKGEELRKVIKKRGKEFVDELSEAVGQVEEKGEEIKEGVSLTKKEMQKKVKEAKEEVTDLAKDQIEHIDELRERGRSAAKFFLRKGKSLS